MRLFAERHLRLLEACAIAVFAALAQAPGLEDRETYRVNVHEVRLSFGAFDRNHQFVNTLTAADIAIVDNDVVVRNFRSFTRSQEMKLNLVVLVDTSDSVAHYFQDEIASVTQLITHGRWMPEDRLSIMTFAGKESHLICSIDCDRGLVAGRLALDKADGQTRLFDAAAFAVRLFSDTRDPAVRSLVMIFSDGEDNGSRYSAFDVISAAQQLEVAIYTVDMNGRKPVSRGSRALRSMAESTGGVHLWFGRNVTADLVATLEDARTSYVVTYAPPNRAAGIHRVGVFPTHDLVLTFRCRSEYLWEAGIQ